VTSTEVSQQTPPGDARTARERALDEFLAAADADFGPVPENVLDDIRAMWPE
jgi:hypothetical protein